MSDSNSQIKKTLLENASIWLLTGHKAGDNNQVLALAEALGCAFEVKKFAYHSYELLTNRLLGVTLAGIDRRRSSQLGPPWPDLVISAGRRNEPVARWIRKQSGGKTRLVHIGRPWAPLDVFDLIITTPQYFLPTRSNVLKNQLPLHRVDSARVQEAASQWQERLSYLQRPYIVVLVGGNSGPFILTTEKGRHFGKMVNDLASTQGGSVLLTDSARTPSDAFHALCEELTAPAYIHQWRNEQANNPYLAYLGLADQLAVTGDSMSMLAEASATCKPLYIFDLGDDERSWWRYTHNFRFKPLSHRLAMKFGPQRMRRDVGRIQHALIADGRAAWLGNIFSVSDPILPPDDTRRAAARVRDLLTK